MTLKEKINLKKKLKDAPILPKNILN